MRERAKACEIVVKKDFEGGGRGGQITPPKYPRPVSEFFFAADGRVQRLSLNRT